MKLIKYYCFNFIHIFLIVLCCLGFGTSCSDDNIENVSIHSIWSNWLNEDKTTPESTIINTTYLGKWIAIKGTGFTNLEAVYCNGRKCPVKEYNKTDNWTIVEVPWDVPMSSEIDDETIKNTIRVVTTSGEAIYKNFMFKNPYQKPAITSVSFSLPVPGQNITIKGENLFDATEIYFPGVDGEIKGEIISADSYSVIVKVPEGEKTNGALRLVCVDENVYSANYMYHKDGLFFNETDLLSNITMGSNCSLLIGEENIINSTGLPLNYYSPSNAFCMPEAPKTIAKAAGYDRINGYYIEFDAASYLRKAISNSSNIFETSSMSDLAIQYDIYMKNIWNSGSATLRMLKTGNISSGSNNFFYAPWVIDEQPGLYEFNDGWETVTVSLKDFEGIVTANTRLIDLIEVLEARNDKSMLAFINCFINNFNQNICTAVPNFQVYFANLRLVPNIIKENQ